MQVKIYDSVRGCGKVWKTLAPSGETALAGTDRLQACSACDGDYEDPERTAWGCVEADEEEDDETDDDCGDR
jgi:hypothetical protein